MRRECMGETRGVVETRQCIGADGSQQTFQFYILDWASSAALAGLVDQRAAGERCIAPCCIKLDVFQPGVPTPMMVNFALFIRRHAGW